MGKFMEVFFDTAKKQYQEDQAWLLEKFDPGLEDRPAKALDDSDLPNLGELLSKLDESLHVFIESVEHSLEELKKAL